MQIPPNPQPQFLVGPDLLFLCVPLAAKKCRVVIVVYNFRQSQKEMMNVSKVHILVIALMSLGFMASVQADPPWARDGGDQHEKHDRYGKHGKYDKHDKVAKRDHFINDDRAVIHDFYAQNPSSLPPGLAKRGGNLPPGLAKRGGNLPPGLSRGQQVTAEYDEVLLPLPKELEIRLPPPPHEVIRRILGHDIVMINKQTRKVLDVMRDALPH